MPQPLITFSRNKLKMDCMMRACFLLHMLRGTAFDFTDEGMAYVLFT